MESLEDVYVRWLKDNFDHIVHVTHPDHFNDPHFFSYAVELAEFEFQTPVHVELLRVVFVDVYYDRCMEYLMKQKKLT